MATVISMIRKPTLRLSPLDDVVIAARPIKAGQTIEEESLKTTQDIPAGHKLAVKAVAKGQPVKRYGQIIGFATQDIAAGEHVHSHV
jgi:altronate hydrolase